MTFGEGGFRFSVKTLAEVSSGFKLAGAVTLVALVGPPVSIRGGLLSEKALLVASTAGGGRECGGGCDIGRGDAETSCLRYEGCESATAGGPAAISLLGPPPETDAGCRLVMSTPLWWYCFSAALAAAAETDTGAASLVGLNNDPRNKLEVGVEGTAEATFSVVDADRFG